MHFNNLLLFGLLLLCAGCTTDIGGTIKGKGVQSVSVDRRVDVQRPLSGVFDAHTGNLNVAIAGLIVNEMDKNKIAKLSATMQENEIRIPEMVRAQVTDLLQKEKGIQVVTNAADAVLVVSIRQYGFDGGNSEDSKNTPFIELSAELTRKGERLWKGVAAAPPMRPGNPKARLQEYQTQPNLLREHWRIQIDRTARKLLTVKQTP
jgi:hypothetical protein